MLVESRVKPTISLSETKLKPLKNEARDPLPKI